MFSVGDMYFFHKKAISENTAENTSYLPKVGHIQVKGIFQDITERTKSEEKIRNFANIVESSNDAIITGSLDTTIISWNKAAEQMYGYSAEEVMGKSASILESDNVKGEVKHFYEKIKRGDKIQHFETSRLKKDGTVINISLTLSPVFDAGGRLVAISSIARDITKRKEAQETMEKMEIARKKEIHHRIKNNLQVISSLLDLQAEKFRDKGCIEDSEVLTAFRESQDRVMSIALIHEELHEGRGNDTLNFSPYLEMLVKNLFQTYRIGNTNTSLNLELEENIFFEMDIAVPLGIIINELISNSLKHAFPGREKGTIRIKLCREESGECANNIGSEKVVCKGTDFIITVLDNGVGMPESFNSESSDSLGLQLVTILVDQLNGKIELNSNNGTEFTIRFSTHERNK
jgi:PAS domain S-box-containing protein